MYRIALCLTLAALLAAQDFRAILTGRISDTSGGSVVGARVALTNLETGIVSAGASNATSNYTIPSRSLSVRA